MIPQMPQDEYRVGSVWYHHTMGIHNDQRDLVGVRMRVTAADHTTARDYADRCWRAHPNAPLYDEDGVSFLDKNYRGRLGEIAYGREYGLPLDEEIYEGAGPDWDFQVYTPTGWIKINTKVRPGFLSITRGKRLPAVDYMALIDYHPETDPDLLILCGYITPEAFMARQRKVVLLSVCWCVTAAQLILTPAEFCGCYLRKSAYSARY
jgi:hypothetical protein